MGHGWFHTFSEFLPGELTSTVHPNTNGDVALSSFVLTGNLRSYFTGTPIRQHMALCTETYFGLRLTIVSDLYQGDATRASMWVISTTTRMLFQKRIKAYRKETIQALHYFVLAIHRFPMDPPHKETVIRTVCPSLNISMFLWQWLKQRLSKEQPLRVVFRTLNSIHHKPRQLLLFDRAK